MKIITDISFCIALVSIAVFMLSIITPLKLFVIVLYLTMFGIPLSILSLFSREKMIKRLVALAGNLLPVSLVVYALVMDFMDEFTRGAP
ncbi:hypothetical protein FZC84_00535 [Rossellomorea vietnamensis]|uniref:Uncharacterized protein n=1 Tax=Rossellomorea vietnamensis TaxID=218284 RepID=A0A5D4MH86_9BACI|nr:MULTISPECIES: hypothetical protein [Bacillaceae]TYS01190.1 hypothetical protein FZC84_00535 [Rossellomorea vietnamensis]